MRTALDEVESAERDSMPLDPEFVESTSALLHEKWLEEKNPEPFGDENVPYGDLEDKQKEPYRIIVRQAIEVHANGTE